MLLHFLVICADFATILKPEITTLFLNFMRIIWKWRNGPRCCQRDQSMISVLGSDKVLFFKFQFAVDLNDNKKDTYSWNWPFQTHCNNVRASLCRTFFRHWCSNFGYWFCPIFKGVFNRKNVFHTKSWNSKNNLEKAACESKSAQRFREMFGNETQEKSVGIFLVHFILWRSIPNVIRTIFQHFEVKNFSISSLNIPVIKTLPLVKRSCCYRFLSCCFYIFW